LKQLLIALLKKHSGTFQLNVIFGSVEATSYSLTRRFALEDDNRLIFKALQNHLARQKQLHQLVQNLQFKKFYKKLIFKKKVKVILR